jgi:hypothetical protein
LPKIPCSVLLATRISISCGILAGLMRDQEFLEKSHVDAAMTASYMEMQILESFFQIVKALIKRTVQSVILVI